MIPAKLAVVTILARMTTPTAQSKARSLYLKRSRSLIGQEQNQLPVPR